jgi:ubiquitin conjugation factor E4 B
VYLAKVIRDFNRENLPHVITAEHFEKAIYLRLAMDENTKPEWEATFDYMVNCWLRTENLLQRMKTFQIDEVSTDLVNRRVETAKELQRIFLNYSGLLINQDCVDLFPLNHTYYAGYWGSQLGTRPNPELSYPRPFVQAFIERYKEDGLMKYFTNTIKALMTVVRSKRVWKDYEGPFNGLEYLLSFKEFADLAHQLFNWSPKYANAATIEVIAFLGPFFARVTCFADSDHELTKQCFPPSDLAGESVFSNFIYGSRNTHDVESTRQSMRSSMKWIQEKQFRIIMSIIRTGNTGRDQVLDLIAKVIRLNGKRSQTNMQKTENSSDGYMLNWTMVCLQLCDPFVDSNLTRVNSIDIDYYLKTNRVDLTDQTRIWADLEFARDFAAKYKEKNPEPGFMNFITEIFCLTLGMLHYGYLGSVRYYNRFVKEVEDMQRHGQRHIANRDHGIWLSLDEATRTANEQGLARLQGELDSLIGYKLAMETGLMDADYIMKIGKFYNVVMGWLLKVAIADRTTSVRWSPVTKGISSPFPLFPITTSPEFQVLPEFIIEDICDFFLFALRYDCGALEVVSMDELLTFALVCLYNDTFIKNPYLKSRLIDILFMMTVAIRRDGTVDHFLRQQMYNHPLAREYLVHVLIRYYVDVEQTGLSSQFYDKFNTRFNISKIFAFLLKDQRHVQKLSQLPLKQPDLFIRFAALVNNDTTYLLDEALGKLKEISALERAIFHDRLDNSSQRNAEREQQITALERHTASYMQLAKEALTFMTMVTAYPNVKKSFCAPEVVLRFTAMLDFNIVRLAGPKCVELKVKQPNKVHFDPKKFISAIVDVYANFGPESIEFLEAMAKDGRSFSKPVFSQAAGILTKFNLRDPVSEFDIGGNYQIPSHL